jgi:Ca2+/Na+ antiporter
MIIVNSLRVLALILLVIILIIKEIPFKKLFKDAMIQFYLALTCILFLLLVDNIFGFILSICLLSLYFRIYTSELNIINNSNNKNNDNNTGNDTGNDNGNNTSNDNGNTIIDKCVMNMDHINIDKNLPLNINNSSNSANSADGTDVNCLVPYITEENLLAAQSNIFNPEGYNKEFYGVDKGIYKEDVYGSQGLDNKNIHVRGYDTKNTYLGNMQYDIL